MRILCAAALALPGAASPLRAQTPAAAVPLRAYDGPSTKGVDTTTLTGKVMCGYQGWFSAEGDGSETGWQHWTKNRRRPGAENIRVDAWPDVSELSPSERFATDLKHADGRPAELFSSFRRETVLRHFQWMREYGIDGAFVQRFVTDLRDPRGRRHFDTVLSHCREGANLEGRAWAVMYDLSGMGAGRLSEVRDDWRKLREEMKAGSDPAYLKHRGRPLVAVWGVGFSDSRAYSLAECREVVEFLKKDGCSVMLGVPTFWRELKADALPDPVLHEILRLADVVSPWTVGRYRDDEEAARHAEKVMRPDLAWCATAGLDYLPVVFPGFSWHNMNRRPNAPFDAIPRRGGKFLWSQCVAAKREGAASLYVAMFDETDEATAVFKCTGDPPDTGDVRFIAEKGIAPDHYLRLCGQAARLIRGEIPADEALPAGK